MLVKQFSTTHFPDDPVLDSAYSTALLRRIADTSDGGRHVRLYNPSPTLSFGRLDSHRPQFPAAVAAARAHGFTPVVRSAGGRAAAFHQRTLVIEILAGDTEGMLGARPRFRELTSWLVATLRDLDIDARIGAVPGEYCPGEWSINGAGRVKLAGTAQRIIAGGWLFGAEMVVTDPEPTRAVLAAVNAALGTDFDPLTAAALSDFNPDITVERLRTAVLDRLGAQQEVPADETTLADAIADRASHSA